MSFYKLSTSTSTTDDYEGITITDTIDKYYDCESQQTTIVETTETVINYCAAGQIPSGFAYDSTLDLYYLSSASTSYYDDLESATVSTTTVVYYVCST